MQAKAGVGETLNQIKEVAVINNDTPMHKVGLSNQEQTNFNKIDFCYRKKLVRNVETS